MNFSIISYDKNDNESIINMIKACVSFIIFAIFENLRIRTVTVLECCLSITALSQRRKISKLKIH